MGVSRAFFVADGRDEKEVALERRLQNRARQLRLATQPNGTVLGGPDRAIGDPHTVNVRSAMYGCPEEIAQQLQFYVRLVPVTSSSTGVAQAPATGVARATDASPSR